MQAFFSISHTGNHFDGELHDGIPTSSHPPTQEEFENARGRRAAFRALGEVFPIIAVMVVFLIFSLIN